MLTIRRTFEQLETRLQLSNTFTFIEGRALNIRPPEDLFINGDVHGDGNLVPIAIRSTDGIVDTLRMTLDDGRIAAFGDLDGDGDLDAVIGGNHSASELLFNDGSGHFMTSNHTLGGSHVHIRDIALGDVDGDGDVDALVGHFPEFFLAGGGGGENTVWINNGTGELIDSGQLLGESAARTEIVALQDVDGDADLDAFMGNWQLPDEIWLNDGSGTFVDSGQRLGSFQTMAVAFGDLDRDGDVDAFVSNQAQPDHVWLNNGVGLFVASEQQFASSNSAGVALGDLDGDGDLDAVVRSGSLLVNDGSGVFVEAGLNPVVWNDQPYLVDVDRDGDLDVFTGSIWLNTTPQLLPGDANRDFRFDQRDIVQVLQTAKYLTREAATFDEGDWNADGFFDQVDILAALQTGNYLIGLEL